MFSIPKNLGEYGKWYDENLYPFTLKQISEYYLRHIKTDGTIDITKFDSTFHKNEISHFNNAVITKTWYKNLNLKINIVTCGLVLLILYDIGKTVCKIYRKKKDSGRVDDL